MDENSKKVIKKIGRHKPHEIVMWLAVIIISTIVIVYSYIAPFNFQITGAESSTRHSFRKISAGVNNEKNIYTVQNIALGVHETIVIGENLNNRIDFKEGDILHIALSGSLISIVDSDQNLEMNLGINLIEEEIIDKKNEVTITAPSDKFTFEVPHDGQYYITFTNSSSYLYHLENFRVVVE